MALDFMEDGELTAKEPQKAPIFFNQCDAPLFGQTEKIWLLSLSPAY